MTNNLRSVGRSQLSPPERSSSLSRMNAGACRPHQEVLSNSRTAVVKPTSKIGSTWHEDCRLSEYPSDCRSDGRSLRDFTCTRTDRSRPPSRNAATQTSRRALADKSRDPRESRDSRSSWQQQLLQQMTNSGYPPRVVSRPANVDLPTSASTATRAAASYSASKYGPSS